MRANGPQDITYHSLLDEFPNARRPGHHVDDIEWLYRVGENGWLAITRDLSILTRDEERAALIAAKARVVFLDAGNAPRRALAEFVIRRIDWLRRIYRETPPPFAYVTTLDGPPSRVDLSL